MGNLGSLSAHAGITTIEDRRGLRARCPSAPVPVLQRYYYINLTKVVFMLTGWVPLYPHSLLSDCSYDQVKYLCHERKFPLANVSPSLCMLMGLVTYGSVDGEGILDVDGNKVIVSRLRTGILSSGQLGWPLGETCYR